MTLSYIGQFWPTLSPSSTSCRRSTLNTDKQTLITRKAIIITLFAILSILSIVSIITPTTFFTATAWSEFSNSVITLDQPQDHNKQLTWHANWVDQDYYLQDMLFVWVILRFDLPNDENAHRLDESDINSISAKFGVVDISTSDYMFFEEQLVGSLTPDLVLSPGIPDPESKKNIYFRFSNFKPFATKISPGYNLEINFSSVQTFFLGLLPWVDYTSPDNSPITVDVIGLTVDTLEYQRLGRSTSSDTSLSPLNKNVFRVHFAPEPLLGMNNAPITQRSMSIPLPPSNIMIDKPWYRRHWITSNDSGSSLLLDFSSWELFIEFPKIIYDYVQSRKKSNGGSNNDNNNDDNNNNADEFSTTQIQQSQLVLDITGFGGGFLAYYAHTNIVTPTCMINDYPSTPTTASVNYASQTARFLLPQPLLDDLSIQTPSFLTLKCPQFFLAYQYYKQHIGSSERFHTAIRMDIREVLSASPSTEDPDRFNTKLHGSMMFYDEIGSDPDNNRVFIPFSRSIHASIIAGQYSSPFEIDILPYPAPPSIFFHSKKNLITAHCQFALTYKLNGFSEPNANTARRDEPGGDENSEALFKKFEAYYYKNSMSLHLSFPLMDTTNYGLDVTLSTRVLGKTDDEIEELNYVDNESKKMFAYQSFRIDPQNWYNAPNNQRYTPPFKGSLFSMFKSTQSTILGVSFTGYVDTKKWDENQSLCQVFLGFHPSEIVSTPAGPSDSIKRPSTLLLETMIPPKVIGNAAIGKESKFEFISLSREFLSFEIDLTNITSGKERVDSTQKFSISLSHGKWQFHSSVSYSELIYNIMCYDIKGNSVNNCKLIKIRVENNSKVFFEIDTVQDVVRFTLSPANEAYRLYIVSTPANSVTIPYSFETRTEGSFLPAFFNTMDLYDFVTPNPEPIIFPSIIDSYLPDQKLSNLVLTATLYGGLPTDLSPFEIQSNNNNDNSSSFSPLFSTARSAMTDPVILHSASVSFHPEDLISPNKVSSRSGALPGSGSSSTVVIAIVVPIVVVLLIILIIVVCCKIQKDKENKQNDKNKQNNNQTPKKTNNNNGQLVMQSGSSANNTGIPGSEEIVSPYHIKKNVPTVPYAPPSNGSGMEMTSPQHHYQQQQQQSPHSQQYPPGFAYPQQNPSHDQPNAPPLDHYQHQPQYHQAPSPHHDTSYPTPRPEYQQDVPNKEEAPPTYNAVFEV